VAGWEDRAAHWTAWARTPGHDAYWRYRDAFFADVVPPPAGPALDLGCGEGRVTRDLAAAGHEVTGLDPSPTLLAAAREQDPGGTYVEGAAEALPFPDASFALVVAYNALMDVDDMPRAVAEAARVLAPGGRLCACVTHPMADAADWDDDGRLVVTQPYLRATTFAFDDERDGLPMRWDGHRFALAHYARALEAAGLLVERLREPPPDPPTGHYAAWAELPMFLMWRALKPA
jgi:SAM-dependent methyltransferase